MVVVKNRPVGSAGFGRRKRQRRRKGRFSTSCLITSCVNRDHTGGEGTTGLFSRCLG